MSARRCGALFTLALSLGASSAAIAADPLGEGLKRCAAVADSASRLSCYDALSGRTATEASSRVAPVPAAAAAAPAVMPPTAAPASPASTAAAPAAAVSAPAPAAVAPPDPAEAARNFGLSSAPQHSAPLGLQSIEARVAQLGVDRALRSFVVLDNGQTWLSTDGGMELDTGEQVTIKHAALGSFMLVSATSKHSYHVRRLR